MVIKDDNASFLSDLMCVDPDFAVSLIEEAIKKSTGTFQEQLHSEIKDIVQTCSCTKTPDGVKACLVLSREDMSDRFEKPGISLPFNNFMGELDELVEEARHDLAVEWYL